MRKAYSTDVSDAEWSYLKAYLPTPKPHGRPRVHGTREVLNAIFYIVRGGCPWRLLPHDFPPWKTVYHYFRAWRMNGTWERMHAALRECARVRLKRNPQLVDTQGLVLEVKVHSARVMDREGIKPLLGCIGGRFPRLSHLWLDAGYNGQGKGADWVQKALGWTAEVVRRPPKVAPQEVMKARIREWAKEGVTIDWQKLLPMEDSRAFLPGRWVVERTFSWLAQNRRLSKDYERLTETSEAFVYVAMTRLMVRGLACAWVFLDSFNKGFSETR